MNPASQVAHLPHRARQVFYGWWLVAISGLVMVIATVPLYHATSIWAVALERQFGWSRTQLGLALTFTRVEGGVMGPVEGYLTDRLGTRRMVLIGLLIVGAGFLLFWQIQNLWMFYLAFVVIALGQGLGSWVPLMTALNNWFVRRRAMAMGWANVGSRFGALLLVPAIAWAIDPDHGRLGWQNTALILGIVTLVVAFPLAQLIRSRPSDYNQRPDGDPPDVSGAMVTSRGVATPVKGKATTAASDFTASQALRAPAFWLISFGHGFTSMVILAIMTHLGLMMKDRGFDIQTVGWVVAVYTGVAMVFQIVGGYLGDRTPKRVALFIFTSIQAGAVVLLTFSSGLAMLYVFAVLFGIGFGGRNPLTTAIRGDYFGRASFGKILGLSTVPMNILLLIASPLAGYMRDVLGDYTLAFLILAALNFLGGILFLMAKRPELHPSPRRAEAAGRAA